MDDALMALRLEFEGAEDSFLLRLRGDSLQWDRAAFRRLERTMRLACERNQGTDRLERWVALGFYYTPRFVRDWTSHPNFPRPEPEEYYNDCLERLDDLADWYFQGYHNYLLPHTWPDL